METENREIIGYGWLSNSERQGEAEVSVAVSVTGRGYGTRILHNLDKEAKKLGYTCIAATVRPENPCARDVITWLFKNGYKADCFPEGSQEVVFEAGKKIPISMVKSI
ncbi:GNAT family N-acetyltransferase [Desulfofundulus salinus]|uniref:GNAT family N-acetyltransferase n=1 Tax=Desulfofundulus salinus TaxID=2419843 RepID=A0A494WX61_9FIRM|nr:GNAT family N-acetyltransferase [Desulfofundulus salinum]RKO66892.1 GNAT family N-acetyltransferase [Desulfofundulus salinum]